MRRPEAERFFDFDGDMGRDGVGEDGVPAAGFLELCGVDVVEVGGVAARFLNGLDEADSVQDLVVFAAAVAVDASADRHGAVALDPEAEAVFPGLGLGAE